jgi:hypothetical protein
MVGEIQALVLCECIETRIGEIFTAGGKKPVFIMVLHNETINEPLIKYFNCKRSKSGNYTVPHNSDFAKLYRCTLGTNPKKRYSEAHKILKHLLGRWFFTNYERAQLQKGKQYLKVTHIEPVTPVKNDAWTFDGTLKKTNKKATFTNPETEEILGINRGQFADKQRKNRGQSADSEALQAPKSLGLEPFFHPTKTLNIQSKTTKTQDHVLDAEILVNGLTDVAKGFYYERLDVLLNSFQFPKNEAESLTMQAVITLYGQAAYLPKPIVDEGIDEWLRDYDRGSAK